MSDTDKNLNKRVSMTNNTCPCMTFRIMMLFSLAFIILSLAVFSMARSYSSHNKEDYDNMQMERGMQLVILNNIKLLDKIANDGSNTYEKEFCLENKNNKDFLIKDMCERFY